MTDPINTLMEQASQALADMDYLTSERLCLDALAKARQAGDWRLYARILLPLQECRRQRRIIAADGWVRLGSTTLGDPASILDNTQPGCILLTHPHRPEDARKLAQAASDQGRHYLEVLYADGDASAAVWTLRSFDGPAVTATVDAPPASWRDRPLSLDEPWPGPKPAKGIAPRPGDWFIHATEVLGDAALAGVKAPLGTPQRVAELENCLRVVVDHEFLHQRLADAARSLAQANASAPREQA